VPSSPNRTEHIVAVAVPVPGLDLLSYRVTAPAAPAKGARVNVPLGSRTVTGVVVNPAAETPAGAQLRDVTAVLDDRAFLPPAIVDLAVWVGDYYASGPGDALAIAMPPSARRGEASAFRTRKVVRATAGADVAAAEAALRGVKQRAALAHLRGLADGAPLPDLARAGFSGDTIRGLAAAGLVEIRDDIHERDPFAGGDSGHGEWTMARADTAGYALTTEQEEALRRLESIADAATFKSVLLHGVTGSGKTELYLRLTQHVIASGRRALILVPEIALTPSAAGQFRARFGPRVAIQHSALSEGERHDQWQRIRRGDVDVVIGTRSAVFAPLENVALIVVDEEHESSYKQDESPRYNGRDVAVMRAHMEGAMVLLGSATPSLESAANARAGRYELMRLTRRVLDRPLAQVRIVDMRPEFAAQGADVTFSAPLLEAIEQRLSRGEQSLVLLNRRGFATVIFCRQCGASVECPHCSETLTFHRAARRVRCHYCNYSAYAPKACGQCGGEFLEQSGYGTERLEADAKARFPGARVARVDRDTIRRRGAIARVLNSVAAGEIDILVGTQMIAKGHDFPAVTLVGVISADVGLGLADFRASERTFQLLTQVVGRAGRGETPGEALIQTLYPDHYSIRAAAAQDYEAFFAKEIEFREQMHYPPAVSLINVIVKGRTLDAAMADAAAIVAQLRRQPHAGRILGPAPAPLARLKDEYRVQFLVKGARRAAMRQAVAAALAATPELRRRVIVDVDPLSTM